MVFKLEANKLGLLFILSFISHLSLAQTIEVDKTWLRLLRYNKNYFGLKSEVDNKEYFLSSNGKTDPVSELNETIIQFKRPLNEFKNINLHPVCKFPGRFFYLKNHRKIDLNFDLSNCSEFQSFKNKLEINSLSLIFSSYFIDKPASAFGHTLLKLNKDSPLKTDLNSYGVDYSAQVTTKNPFAYGVLGITGGFYGKFSLLPYFLKLREYNDYESRDLWEFELNFTKDDLDFFVAHLWDMNLALFDYYYFTENCSYHVLRLIETVKPEWNLMDEIYSIVIPIDTIIPLVESPEKYLKGIYFRKSQAKKTEERIRILNNEESEKLAQIINSRKTSSLNNSSPDSQRNILDAAIDFVDYKYSSEIFLKKVTHSENIQNFKQELLIKRSSLDSPLQITSKEKIKKFNFSHTPRKIALGHKTISRYYNAYGLELSHRFALHDIKEENGIAFSDFTLEMGRTKFFLNQKNNQLFFEEFELAHVEALRPITFLESKFSWNFSFGARASFEEKNKTFEFHELGLGFSKDFDRKLFIALYLQSSSQGLSTLNSEARYLNFGPQLKAFYKFESSSLNLNLNISKNVLINEQVSYPVSFSYFLSKKNYFLELSYENLYLNQIQALRIGRYY